MNDLKPGKIYESEIQKLAFGGKGIARIDDFVVMVKGGIPGQVVRLQITKKKKHYAEAKVLEVLKRSEIERESEYPPMPGCVLQNIAYADQLAIKESQVTETLEHLGNVGTNDIEILPIIPSPQQIRYRNKVEFSFGYERMWVEHDEEGNRIFHDENPSLGFHPQGKWALVQSIEDCFLASENANTIRAEAEEMMRSSSLPVWNPKIHRGFWRNLIVRESVKTGDILVNFVVSESKPNSFWDDVATRLVDKVPSITGIIVTVHEGKSDFLDNPETQTVWGQNFLVEKLEDTEFEISPFSFFQTNTLGAEKLFGVVRDFAQLKGDETILDLFCGSGAIGLFLSQNVKKIVGLEMNESAIADARANAKRNNVQNAHYFCGKAEKILPDMLEEHPEFDVLILDPPRAGIHPKAMDIILQIPTDRIVLVSCNPATLARDLEIFQQGGWIVRRVQSVDMFPHTPHIEVVVEMVRKKGEK